MLSIRKGMITRANIEPRRTEPPNSNTIGIPISMKDNPEPVNTDSEKLSAISKRRIAKISSKAIINNIV